MRGCVWPVQSRVGLQKGFIDFVIGVRLPPPRANSLLDMEGVSPPRGEAALVQA